MSKWIYAGKPLTRPPEETIGFIYRVTSKIDMEVDGMIFKAGTYYIGQKQFYSNRTKVLSKKASEAAWKGRGPKPKKQKVQSSSGWESYCTSSELLKKLISLFGEEAFYWEILFFACSTSGLDYLETKTLLIEDALLDNKNLNVWVSCKIRRNNICI